MTYTIEQLKKKYPPLESPHPWYEECTIIPELYTELEARDAEIERLKSKCPSCGGSGVEYSGVCHCGEEMERHTGYSHNHSPVEMERPCETCTAAVRLQTARECAEIVRKYDGLARFAADELEREFGL